MEQGNGGALHRKPKAWLFLDWDDSLFPTSELFERWLLPKLANGQSLTEAQEASVSLWRTALEELFTAGIQEGCRLAIITNAQTGWVEACLERFAPSLRPLLASGEAKDGAIRVEYALARYRDAGKETHRALAPLLVAAERRNSDRGVLALHEHNHLMTAAKMVAMKTLVASAPGRDLLLSIGDMPFEKDAVQEVQFTDTSGRPLRTKAITLGGEDENCEEIARQLRLVAAHLGSLAAKDGDSEVTITSSTQTAPWLESVAAS